MPGVTQQVAETVVQVLVQPWWDLGAWVPEGVRHTVGGRSDSKLLWHSPAFMPGWHT